MVATDYLIEYTVELEATAESSVRVIATNLTDQSLSETFLTLEQMRSLLKVAYEGQPSSVDNYMELVNSNHTVALYYSANELLRLTREDLVKSGLNPDDFRKFPKEQ